MFSICTLPLVLSALLAAEGKPSARLVEGRFGKALDASVTPLAFGGDQRYRTPPLTVECWARLRSKRLFNVLVSSDPKSSAQHWEIYSYAGRGTFSAYLPGYEPSEIVSKTKVCDDRWHHLAMTFDGKTVRLFVDGKSVHDQTVKPRAGLKPVPGPLSVGQAIEGTSRIGCDGLIDEVRLSRVVRKITLPTAPPVVDADTIGLWRFEDSDTILADPAWTPPPSTTGEKWERETDVDWVDARLRKMDTGPTFNATMRYPHGKGQVTVYKATAIRIGDRGEGGVIFDRNQLRLAAAWTGGFLKHSDRRFALLNTPTPDGKTFYSSASEPGWADARGEWTDRPTPSLPMPHDRGRFRGLHLHGKRVVLSYTVNRGVEVRESPWLETIAGQTVLVRTMEVGPSKERLQLHAGDFQGTPKSFGIRRGIAHQGAMRSLVAVLDRPLVVFPRGADAAQVVLPPSTETQVFRIVNWTGQAKYLPGLLEALSKRPAAADLSAWIAKPGPARWTRPLVTTAERGADTGPYALDTLTLPYDNPYHALFFTSGLGFLPDGRIAVCTAHGDVWLARSDAKQMKLHWQRFATGLYQPLGLTVVDGKVIVLERGQLTRLHDLDGNGEADWYENLCHDWHTGSGEHSYDTCLETDRAGNFYFFKGGDTHLPHGGCLLRVARDGKKVEVFATGFRHPIGLSVSPTDVVTGADQEGNWMPSTRVDVYRKGGFYGDMRAHHRDVPPTKYDPPLLWLPKDADNSAGGQVWVPHDRFGLPKGQLLHFSYGRCKVLAVSTQKVGDVEQAGAVDLGLFFLSGAMRARFHPEDGHLYVCGLRGWQNAARRDGCLQRVRYTGKPVTVPVGLHVQADGIRLTFAQKLGTTAAEKARYRIEQWNYRWSADYGSKRWSVKQPGREGPDLVEIDRAILGEDGKSVFLAIKGLAPVMQMRIGYEVPSADGKTLSGTVYNTIHRLAPATKP